MKVKMPVLLDGTLKESAILYPTKGTLKIKANDVSEAQLTLSDKSQAIPMHGWVKIYNQNGFVGVFRRTSRNNNVTVDKTVTLRHGIDILQDSVWEGSEDFSGTMTQYLTAILNHQTSLINGVKPWVLGTCADTQTVAKTLNYDNLMTLLKGTVDNGGDYYFTFDQTVWPWQINLVAKPSGVKSEFRLNRNIEKCKISDNDSEICTRLILNVNKLKVSSDADTQDENQSVWRVYNNSTAQAAYGIITKTADIDVTQDTLPGGPFPEADAWAADFLAKRAEPQLQIQIDGLVLSQITGQTWDESRICELCRVALPEYAEAISQRVVTINYPDLFGAPERVSVSLANVLPSYTNSLNDLAHQTSVLATENRYTERVESSFSKRFAIYDKQGNILHQAGLELDAYGMLVYADDGVNMIGSRFEVQANKIGMVVGTIDGADYIKAGEIALAINASTGESEAIINADHVYINATDDVKSWAAGTDATLVAQSAAIQTLTAQKVTADQVISIVDGGTFSSITTTSLTVGGQSIAPNTVVSSCSSNVSGNTVTLYFTRPGGSPVQFASFSRAVSQRSVSALAATTHSGMTWDIGITYDNGDSGSSTLNASSIYSDARSGYQYGTYNSVGTVTPINQNDYIMSGSKKYYAAATALTRMYQRVD